MHITRIELENIKSHRESVFDFARGTTAITGENGAGKTTLIEAVAWTLFDFLDYKKEDFVTRGSKKGTARVTFESGLDGREYTVVRDTGTGYNVFDPQLKMRVADKKEEVTRFLWQHLGVEPGTDLESLFRRAIGVPQGTFTAIFLESATERKKAFDKLLKVEEYRQGSDKLRDTVRFIENQLSDVREKIARFEGELSRFESLAESEKQLAADLKESELRLADSASKVEFSSQRLKEFDRAETEFNAAKAEHDLLSSEMLRLESILTTSSVDVEVAAEAAKLIKSLENDHAKHLNALAELKDLESKRAERDRLNRDLSSLDNDIISANATRKNLDEKIDRIKTARLELTAAKEKIAEQERLEKEIAKERDRLSQAKAALEQQNANDERLVRLRQSYKANREKLADAEKAAAEAAGIADLRKREVELTNSIAAMNAKLERDKAFQIEIKNGLCPILSQKCLNLKEGQTLEGFVDDIFEDLTAQIAGDQREKSKLAVKLNAALDAEKRSAGLAGLREREAEIKEEGERLNAEKAKLEEIAGTLAAIDRSIDALEKQLAELADPRGRSRLLEKEVADDDRLRTEIGSVGELIKKLEIDRGRLAERSAAFADVDSDWKKLINVRNATDQAYRDFLANEKLAASLPEKEKTLIGNQELANNKSSELKTAKTKLEIAEKSYNREKHNELRTEHIQFEKDHVEIAGTAKYLIAQLDEIRKEIDRLAETRKLLNEDYREKERLESVAEATKFIRDVLKDAAPQVAKNYVFHVSVEANNLFREIGGNAERTLKWTEDYGIVLEEGGYDRPFSSLSGGEQMTAALSVRLALLKQLTDIRIAFFDEPTTNMDAERRENLAMQISRITHFDQLFVISHDDTFEGYMDHEITVERE